MAEDEECEDLFSSQINSLNLPEPSYLEYLTLGFDVETGEDGSISRKLPDFNNCEELTLDQVSFLMQSYVDYSLNCVEKIKCFPVLYLEINEWNEIGIRDVYTTVSLTQFHQGFMAYVISILELTKIKIDKYKKRHSKRHHCNFPKKTSGAQLVLFKSNKYHNLFCFKEELGSLTWFDSFNKTLHEQLDFDHFVESIKESKLFFKRD